MPTCSRRTHRALGRPARLSPVEGEEIAAQRTACDLLVRSCEQALFDLRCAIGEAADPQEVRSGLRAIELLQDVLVGWLETRETLAVAHSLPGADLLPHVHRR
jgi:hypothetical protein